jgi:phage terminase large subunit-like protein
MSTKDQLLELLEAQAKDREVNRLAHFKPYPKQKEFCDATADYSEIVLQAGNQLGKSEIGAYATAVFATGRYPDTWQGRRFDGPTRGWACGESTIAVRDVAQRKLLGPPGDNWLLGTGLVPKDCIVNTISSHGAGGAIDKALIRHVSGGVSEITFKSYDQDRSKWQGDTLNYIWCDEEPPEEHYFEALARLTATRGVLYSTFTPLSGFNKILPRFYREKDPVAAAGRHVIRMRMDDAGHLADPEVRARLMASYPEHQRRTRIDGYPMQGSGAVFEGVDLDDLREQIFVREGEIINATDSMHFFRAWALLWAVDFGIDHPFAAVLLAHDRDADCIHVLAEVRIRGGVPATHASAMKRIASNVPVAWPHDGNQRDKGSGRTLASQYKAEGLKMLPTHATFRDGGYNTEPGIMDMLSRMQSGRFKVSDHCREWHDEFSTYHRKDGLIVKQNDDLMSATRIGVMQIRSAKVVTLDPEYRGWGGEGRRSQQGNMAQGVDFDVFDV